MNEENGRLSCMVLGSGSRPVKITDADADDGLEKTTEGLRLQLGWAEEVGPIKPNTQAGRTDGLEKTGLDRIVEAIKNPGLIAY